MSDSDIAWMDQERMISLSNPFPRQSEPMLAGNAIMLEERGEEGRKKEGSQLISPSPNLIASPNRSLVKKWKGLVGQASIADR
jgi:hypothetical protein